MSTTAACGLPDVKSRPPILERPVFERLLFAQCWEDPRLDALALRVGPDDVVLSVTSGGCNALSLAALGPERIICVDLNRAQQAMLHLKIAGAQELSHGEYLELLGVRRSKRRLELYRRCRGALPPVARAYWDLHARDIARGALVSGRYERYLAAFRKILRLIQGRRRIERLFEPESPEDQEEFYREEWDTRLWRAFFRLFFSRSVLGLAGLDRAFFTYVEGIPDFGSHFLARARHVLVDLPLRENYFVAQIALGRYLDERELPPYLLAGNFEALRQAVGRIEVVTEELGGLLARLPTGTVDCFSFSNVFEWVPPAVFETMLRETHRVARPGARLCYRNLLVRRCHPPALDGWFAPDGELAERLLREDRSFVYSHFEVATVLKPHREGALP